MTLWPWLFDLYAKNSFLDFVALRGVVFHKHILLFVLLSLLINSCWKLMW